MENIQEEGTKVATPGQSGKAEDLGGEDGQSKELKMKGNATAKGKAKPGSKEASATPVKDPSAKQEKMYDGEGYNQHSLNHCVFLLLLHIFGMWWLFYMVFFLNQ